MNKTGGISCHHVRQDQNGSYQETKQVPTLLNTKDNKTDPSSLHTSPLTIFPPQQLPSTSASPLLLFLLPHLHSHGMMSFAYLNLNLPLKTALATSKASPTNFNYAIVLL